MSRGKWWLAVVAGALTVVIGASIAMASDLDEGVYTLDLPFVGELFVFEVDYDGDPETVFEAAATPSGYEIDDDDPDKVAWRDIATMELEVEAKLDKVEADHDWLRGDAVLTLPDGGTITIIEPDGNGAFMVMTTGDWSALSDENNRDWYVVNGDETEFFKVEADEDGVEIKAVDGLDDGFLKELEDEEVEELEIETEELEEEAEEEDKDKDDD